MPTTVLLPSGAGTYTQWPSRYNCASNYICCQTSDADTSYVYGPRDVSKTDTYSMDNAPAAAAVCTQHVPLARCRRSGTAANNAFACYERSGGTNRAGGSYVTVTDSYQDDQETRTDMADGSLITIKKINSMECGVTCNNVGGGNQIRCTYVRNTITWAYGGGGSAWILTEILLPVLGTVVGVTRDMMPGLAGLAARVSYPRTTWFLPHEYDYHFEAFSRYVYPTTFDFGGLAWAA